MEIDDAKSDKDNNMTIDEEDRDFLPKVSYVKRSNLEIEAKREESDFLLPGWKIKTEKKLLITMTILVISIFMERYTFITSVYKTKYYGYVLILSVIFLNTIFNYFNMKLRSKRRKRNLIEMFNIERTPTVNWFVIGFIGYFFILHLDCWTCCMCSFCFGLLT